VPHGRTSFEQIALLLQGGARPASTSPLSDCGPMRTISFRAFSAAVFIARRKAVSSLGDDNAASLRIADFWFEWLAPSYWSGA
jgi:hypothetical protein